MSEKPKSIILIIDDSKERQKSLSELIAKDYFIMSAANCAEAKTALNFNFKRISGIILSNKIRGEIPSEFVSFIKSNDSYKNIPVLIFCRSFIDDEAKKCLNAGAGDVFFEPVDCVLLLNRLKNIINLTEAAYILEEIEKDDLTGLYTRQAFLHRANAKILENPGKLYGIMAFDFENFKLTNNQYGEDKCNEFLAYVARRLQSCLNGELMGRFGGDQFILIYEMGQNKSLENINSIISKILLDAPIPHQILKIGSYAPIDSALPIVCSCDYAFLAIQQIKGVYGRNFAVYEESLQQQLLNDQKILENMEKALVEEQFKVFYQPKHDSVTGKIAGAEALVRWNHPVYGFMAPSQFIPLFEKSGFISKLDSFIIKKVCADIVKWQENGIPVVPVSINVSRRDYFENGWLFEQLKIIDGAKIDHSLLHIEVTESLYAENVQFIINQVKRVQEHGFLIEMDDFGAGYSSLGMLSTFPLNIIKLDISFVQNLETNQIVIENIIRMAHSMGLITVAEGVENEGQFKILKNFGCDMIQGFYFSRPLSSEEYEKYLRKNVCSLSKITELEFSEKKIVNFSENISNVSSINDMFDLLPGAFFSFHSDICGQIMAFNKEMLDLLGCNSGEELREYCGNCFKGMIFEDDVEKILCFYGGDDFEIVENKIYSKKLRIKDKNGNVKVVKNFVRMVDSKDFGKIFYNILIDFSE